MTRSIQQLPNNVSSTQVVEVATATGFNAGDAVYYQNGDYKSQPNLTAPSNAQFAISAPSTIFGGASGGITHGLFPTTTSNGYGSSKSNMAAILTNGNIVQVFASLLNSYASWRIINTSGVVQVATTNITSPTAVAGGLVGVLALTGGGFVIFWLTNTSGSIAYAIYSNTGAVVTSTVTEATGNGGTNANCRIKATALANGGFVLTIQNTSSVIWFKVYTSTGGATTSWSSTSLTTRAYSSNSHAIASRSDSSFIIFYNITSTSKPNFQIYSAAGAVTVSNTAITSLLSYWTSSIDVAVLADGLTYVLAYIGYDATTTGGAQAQTFKLLNSSNSQGSETYFPRQNCYVTPNTSMSSNFTLKIAPQASGGFAIFCAPDQTCMPAYAFFNSSGTCLSGTNNNGIIPIYIPNLYWADNTNYIWPTVLEYGGNLNVFYSPQATNVTQYNQYYFQVSTSTYQVVPLASLPTTLSVTSTPSTAYTAGSAISGVKYYAANTEQDVYTQKTSTSLTGITVTTAVGSGSANHACTLSNGNFVIAWISTVDYTVNANVYSPQGSLITSINVDTTNSTVGGNNSESAVRVCALSSGKFVITYGNSTSTTSNYSITSVIYSTAYKVLGTISNAILETSYNTLGAFDCIGISNDLWVLAYQQPGTAYLGYAVFGNTGSTIQAYQTINSNASSQYIALFSLDNGGFGMRATNTGLLYTVYQSAATTWTNSVTAANMGGSYMVQNYVPFSTNNGDIFMPNNSSATALSFRNYASNLTNQIATESLYTLSAGSVGNSGGGASGYTGNGTPVYIYFGGANSASTSCTMYCYGLGSYSSDGSSYGTAYSYPSNNVISFTLSLSSKPNAYIIPNSGFNCVVVWKSLSNVLQFAIISAFPYNSVTSLTSGVSISNPVQVTPSLTAQNAITGAVFTGVAATTASAGSTGQVIINGLAQLNTSYPASGTGAFDYTGLAVDGVKGTFNGRNVNLQGNS